MLSDLLKPDNGMVTLPQHPPGNRPDMSMVYCPTLCPPGSWRLCIAEITHDRHPDSPPDFPPDSPCVTETRKLFAGCPIRKSRHFGVSVAPLPSAWSGERSGGARW